MKPTATADFIPHFSQSPYLHSKHSPTIQSNSQLSNLQINHVAIMSSIFSINFTEIIFIEDNNKKKMKFEKQFIIRVFFDKFKISENLFTRACDEQTDQRDSLNTENISQHLTEINQSNRTHSAKYEKFIKLNSDKLHFFNTEKFSESWYVQIFLFIFYLTILWNSLLKLMINFNITKLNLELTKSSVT